MTTLTDHHNYGGADSGCERATVHLGHQSRCLECPFEECSPPVGVSGASPEAHKAASKRYYQRNREKRVAYGREYRARRKAVQS